MGVANKMGLNKIKKRITKEIDFANFKGGIRTDAVESVLPMKYASKMYNFCIRKNALTTGLGLTQLRLPNSSGNERNVSFENNIYPYYLRVSRSYDGATYGVSDKLLAMCTNGKVYSTSISSNNGSFALISGYYFSTIPEGFLSVTSSEDNKEYMVFSSTGDGIRYCLSGQSITSVSSSPRLFCMCMHFDRVFGIKDIKSFHIWYCSEPTPTNWTEANGGYIQLTDKDVGSAVNLLSFGNYLYIIRDYGITRLTAYGSEEDFELKTVYKGSCQIFGKTATVCGQYIYFMTANGLCRFDGANVTKVPLGFEDVIVNAKYMPAKGAYYKNKYCAIFNTTYQTRVDSYCNTLLMYDLQTGEYDIFAGAYLKDIVSVEGFNVQKLVAIIKPDITVSGLIHKMYQVDETGVVVNLPTRKVWESGYTDLGYADYEKAISKISLRTVTDCQVVITTENGETELEFKGSEKVQSKKVHITGVRVKVAFICNKATCEISSPKITFSLGKPNV